MTVFHNLLLSHKKTWLLGDGSRELVLLESWEKAYLLSLACVCTWLSAELQNQHSYRALLTCSTLACDPDGL